MENLTPSRCLPIPVGRREQVILYLGYLCGRGGSWLQVRSQGSFSFGRFRWCSFVHARHSIHSSGLDQEAAGVVRIANLSTLEVPLRLGDVVVMIDVRVTGRGHTDRCGGQRARAHAHQIGCSWGTWNNECKASQRNSRCTSELPSRSNVQCANFGNFFRCTFKLYNCFLNTILTEHSNICVRLKCTFENVLWNVHWKKSQSWRTGPCNRDAIVCNNT